MIPTQTTLGPRKTARLLRLKLFIANILFAESFGKLLGVLYRDQLPYAGLRIDTSGLQLAGKTKAMLFWGKYESAELRFVKKFILPTIDTVEVGASIGGISSQLAVRLEAGKKLICIEANPLLLPRLRDNLQRYGQHLSLNIQHGAVAYGADVVHFAIARDSLESRVGNTQHSTEVPAVKLSAIIPEGDYQLVCDIEGAEYDIFFQDAEALKKCQRLVIELHEVHRENLVVTVEKLAEMITELGFQLLEAYGNVFVFAKQKR
jgi:FkbM family methyltransferase